MSVFDWVAVVVSSWLVLCVLTTIGAARWLGYTTRKEQQLLEDTNYDRSH